MMDNPALDRMLDQPDRVPMIIWRGIPCEVTEYYEYAGVTWVRVRALQGEPFTGYTHGGPAQYAETSLRADLVSVR